MRKRDIPILLAAGLCLGAPVLPAQTAAGAGSASGESLELPPAQLYGRIDGDTYISPTGAFWIKIPVLPALGGAVNDTPNLVTFDDDFSVHCSVGAFPLSPELQAEFDSRGTQGFLIYFFTKLVMPDFAARCPGANIEDTGVFLPQFQGGAMLIFATLPNGSFFAPRAAIWTPPGPLVAKYGNLCFVKNHHVFVISMELAERSLQRLTYNLTTAQENALLKQRLLAIVARMEFNAPPGAAR